VRLDAVVLHRLAGDESLVAASSALSGGPITPELRHDRDANPRDQTPQAGCTNTAPCDHDPMGLERADVVALYERYLARCNEHRFDELGEFVSEQVSGSGPVDGLAGYIEGVKAVCTAFPDYHWDLRELVVEEDTIAARLIGQGTHTGLFGGIAPTGRRIRTQELVIYRIADGKIDRCWGDLFPVVRDALTASTHVMT
jgi:predicted ester cyclase